MVRSLTLRRKKTRRRARTKKLNKRKRFTKKVKSTRRRRVRRTLTRRKQKGGNEDEDEGNRNPVEVEKPKILWKKLSENEYSVYNGIIVLNEADAEADKIAAAADVVDADELKQLIGDMDTLGEDLQITTISMDEEPDDFSIEEKNRVSGGGGLDRQLSLRNSIEKIYNEHPAAFRNEFRTIIKRQSEQLETYNKQLERNIQQYEEEMIKRNQQYKEKLKAEMEEITPQKTRDLYKEYITKRNIYVNEPVVKFFGKKKTKKEQNKVAFEYARDKLEENLFFDNVKRYNTYAERYNGDAKFHMDRMPIIGDTFTYRYWNDVLKIDSRYKIRNFKVKYDEYGELIHLLIND
jgi:hypothetical protein